MSKALSPLSNETERIVESVIGCTSLTGAPSYSSISDTRRLSIDVPRGIALDLLNELGRSHGEYPGHGRKSRRLRDKIGRMEAGTR
jgi:hypothetical protein